MVYTKNQIENIIGILADGILALSQFGANFQLLKEN
jgi:hypothetical protein